VESEFKKDLGCSSMEVFVNGIALPRFLSRFTLPILEDEGRLLEGTMPRKLMLVTRSAVRCNDLALILLVVMASGYRSIGPVR